MNLRLALPAVANHAVPMHPKRRRSDSIPPQDGLVIRRILPTRSDYVWDQDQPQADQTPTKKAKTKDAQGTTENNGMTKACAQQLRISVRWPPMRSVKNPPA